MEQLSMFRGPRPTLTVTDISRLLRALVESEGMLQDVWIRGEISNFSRPKSGHWYFTLKDHNAQLPCVMWRSTAELQAQVPKDGDQLEVHGGLSVYEAGGRYQLYVDEIRTDGEGALYQRFMQLKAKLEAEGLFDPARKRALPAWPQRIGIVTSPSGAALHDVLQTLARRFPMAEVVLAPAAVQGEEAATEILRALAALNQFAQPDVILLARGGGSPQDLAAFNSERLVRAVTASAAPVVSGVGHETDFTLADFAADLRAPTPTAAAELATPSQADLVAQLEAVRQQLGRYSPAAQIARQQQRLDELALRASRALGGRLQQVRASLNTAETHLTALNPEAVLQRGYAILARPDGAVLSSASQAQPGEALEARLRDGRLGLTVNPKP
ncbi:MAG: exodeoxyribonuclease VII large subunit [Anaerolineales bacterium]|nr:exodeoxyribonuclease VII large subunit [Anaerolineales bacterium]MCW5854489.1 exodeoxyribonuclease VII large subunit [Anaerolineales bacterium]